MTTTEFTWPIRVYYEDTDAGGVVYYANYLRYFERARTEWLNQMKIDQVDLLEQDVAFVVTKAEIDYLKPARLNDELMIYSKIKNVRAASVEFEQELFMQNKNLDKPIMLNKANIKVACLRLKTFSPCRIPKTIKEEFLRVS